MTFYWKSLRILIKIKIKMKQVSLLSSFPPTKGISLYTSELVKELEKHIHINLICFKSIYPRFLYPGDPNDYSLKKPRLKNTKIFQIITWYNPFSWVLAGFKVKEKLHVQWWSWFLSPIYLVILSVAKIRRKKIIMTIHNVLPHEKSFLKNFLTTVIFKFADKIIVHSEQNKKDLRKIRKKTPIKVIPHGVLSLPPKNISKAKARKLLEISLDKKVLLFFGNIRNYKGLKDLLEVFGKLLKTDQNYFLIIAGQCWEDWSIYQEIIDKNNLKKNILRLDGFISNDEIEAIFKSADLLILPYKYFDAQSGVGALGLNFNVPALVSDLDGLKEIAIDKSFIFKRGNLNELEVSIKNIFLNLKKKNLSEKIKDLKIKFSWETIIQETLNFYNEE